MSRPHIILYADVNFGLIDGSSVWAVSAADAFAQANATVTVLSKFPIRDHRVLAPLVDREGVRLVDPELEGFVARGKHIQPAAAPNVIQQLDSQETATAVVVRGREVSDALVKAGVCPGRLWCYLTDIPQSVTDASPEALEQLNRIATGCARLLCQTEQLRTFLERVAPAAIGKTFLFPPIVPDQSDVTRVSRRDDDLLTLVYSGKFAAWWRTLEMCAIPDDLRRRGVKARLLMLGDKIHRETSAPDYFDRMKSALTSSHGVEWLGGLTRREAMEKVAASDVALAWRAPELDASLELSTKLLEFGTCGVPAVLNRTPMHEELLGHDYPLFVSDYKDVLNALVEVARDPAVGSEAAGRLQSAAAKFSRTEAVARISSLLAYERRATGVVGWPNGRDQTVLIAGHDLKFVRPIAEYLDRHTDTRVIFDKWQGHNRHDAALSSARLREADVILCEWMLGNAVWYSHNKRPGQRLVVRLHRVEAETDYPRLCDVDAIDAIIFVGDDMAQQAQAKFGFPDEKIVVVPNAIDCAAMDRRKERGHEYALGMIGSVPIRKRLDLAVDLLRRLRTVDKRFRLYVKGSTPWDLPWVWRDQREREYFERILEEVSQDDDLGDAVVFDKAGADVAAWLRKVGWIVSTSDDESFHVSVAEGMASGAVPLIRKWRGASEIYDKTWLHDDVESMADTVAATLAAGNYQTLADQARSEAARFDLPEIATAMGSVLAGRAPRRS